SGGVREATPARRAPGGPAGALGVRDGGPEPAPRARVIPLKLTRLGKCSPLLTLKLPPGGARTCPVRSPHEPSSAIGTPSSPAAARAAGRTARPAPFVRIAVAKTLARPRLARTLPYSQAARPDQGDEPRQGNIRRLARGMHGRLRPATPGEFAPLVTI